MSSGLSVLLKVIANAPEQSGVYQMIAKNKKILYIGKAKNIKNRLKQYSNIKALTTRIQRMVMQIHNINLITTDTEVEALILELNLIKTARPKYNILLLDDKSFPYIYLDTTHKYPSIYATRNKDMKGKYFGPYTGSCDVYNVLNLLKKSFLIRGCSDHEFASRTTACLEYQIKRCSAPCVSYISAKEYKNLVSETIKFLSGKNNNIKQKLIADMKIASEQQLYDKAIIFRDRIKAINNINAKQSVTDNKLKNSDVIVIGNMGDKIIIEIFFFRNGFNNGNHNFFPKNPLESSQSEILSEFIKQFYNNINIVDEIITNIEINDKENIINMFAKQYQRKISLITPKKGKKKAIIDFALKNMHFTLKQKITNQINPIKNNIYNPLSNIIKNNSLQKQAAGQDLPHHIMQEKLATAFKLKATPKKIELFDNSHISGAHAVGAMVVVTQQGFAKNLYRKFNIKSDIAAGDDYAMLYEVLFRRYSRLIKEDPNNSNNTWPDLILIDGGKGQASIAHEVFERLNINIDFFCIAKGKERNKGKERFCNYEQDYFTISDQSLLYYLQNIRDEVHRFVITAHRVKRTKNTLTSQLDDIPNIGNKRKKSLLEYFGSVKKIKSASIEELCKAPNISNNIANIIKKYWENHDK